MDHKNRNSTVLRNTLITSTPINDPITGFVFKWDTEREKWMIGSDSTSSPNAIISGTACPAIIEIPRNFTYDGTTAPVEIIGRYSFQGCGAYRSDPTKTVFITKQVKIIKVRSFCNGNYLLNFTIEAGSVLETIEERGLYQVGYNARSDSITPILILPFTLKSVAAEGIHNCFLFTEIIYCGLHSLMENTSSLSYSTLTTVVRVIDSYPYMSIFGAIHAVDKSVDVMQICINFLPDPTPSPLSSISNFGFLSFLSLPDSPLLLSLAAASTFASLNLSFSCNNKENCFLYFRQ